MLIWDYKIYASCNRISFLYLVLTPKSSIAAEKYTPQAPGQEESKQPILQKSVSSKSYFLKNKGSMTDEQLGS